MIFSVSVCLAETPDTLMTHETGTTGAIPGASGVADTPGTPGTETAAGVESLPVAGESSRPGSAAAGVTAVIAAPVVAEKISEDRQKTTEAEDAGDTEKDTETETEPEEDRETEESDEETDEETDQKDLAEATAPGFAMTYGANMEQVDTPSTIGWTLQIENTGNTPLTGMNINNRVPESFPDPEGDADPAGVLDVGETWTFTGEFSVTQEMIDGNGVDADNRIDGNGYIDSAVTVAFAETDPQTAKASVQVIQNPDFTVTQIADSAVVDAPKTIIYTIAIENTGNLSLNDVQITAPLLEDLDGPEGDMKNPGILDVGEIWMYTGTYAATQEVIDGAGVNTYNIINNSGSIDSTVLVGFAETDVPQTAFAAVPTKLSITGDIFEKKYRHLHAFVSAKRSYTTNLYRTDNNTESCWATFITPGVWATYPSEMKRSAEIVTANASPGGLAIEPFNPLDFNRFQAYILYSPQFERYHGQKNKAYNDPDNGSGIIDDDDIDRADDFLGSNNSLNRTTHRVDAMLHYHSGNKLSVRAIDQYKISYDEFSERAFYTDDKYKSNMFHIAGTLDPTAKLQARLDYSNFRLNYRNDFNRDDDRRDDAYAAYLFFRLTAKTSFFLNYEFADISYKTSPRDSYEHRYFGGIRWEMTGKSSGQIKGGYGKKRMDSPGMIDTDVAIADITEDNWLAAIQFDHNLTERVNLTLNAYRRYDEVLEHRYNYYEPENFYADYILAHFAGCKLGWKAHPNITLNLDTSLFYDKFKGSRQVDRDGDLSERKDLNFALSPSISIQFTKYLTINGAYIYTDHDSNYPAHDYVDHTFFIRASLSI